MCGCSQSPPEPTYSQLRDLYEAEAKELNRIEADIEELEAEREKAIQNLYFDGRFEGSGEKLGNIYKEFREILNKHAKERRDQRLRVNQSLETWRNAISEGTSAD